MTFVCGHHRSCIFSYVHKGQRMRYCMACLVEKVGLPTIDEQRKEVMPIEKVVDEQEVVLEKVEENEEKKTETLAERLARARAAKGSNKTINLAMA